uniref:Uncharacterized protein n=1 Tax=Solanum lycopersicum TaxID=4081 RepID=A0A3Q7IDT9_SOLLC
MKSRNCSKIFNGRIRLCRSRDAYYGHCDLLLQHQHRDGRVEEVVLRHLGSEDGSTNCNGCQ